MNEVSWVTIVAPELAVVGAAAGDSVKGMVGADLAALSERDLKEASWGKDLTAIGTGAVAMMVAGGGLGLQWARQVIVAEEE